MSSSEPLVMAVEVRNREVDSRRTSRSLAENMLPLVAEAQKCSARAVVQSFMIAFKLVDGQ